MISIPGDPDIWFEALPGSALPGRLRDAGYLVTDIGTTQRILTHAIEDRFVIGTSGELESATAGSTRPISQVVTHARIVATTVYELREPTVPPDGDADRAMKNVAFTSCCATRTLPSWTYCNRRTKHFHAELRTFQSKERWTCERIEFS